MIKFLFLLCFFVSNQAVAKDKERFFDSLNSKILKVNYKVVESENLAVEFCRYGHNAYGSIVCDLKFRHHEFSPRFLSEDLPRFMNALRQDKGFVLEYAEITLKLRGVVKPRMLNCFVSITSKTIPKGINPFVFKVDDSLRDCVLVHEKISNT